MFAHQKDIVIAACHSDNAQTVCCAPGRWLRLVAETQQQLQKQHLTSSESSQPAAKKSNACLAVLVMAHDPGKMDRAAVAAAVVTVVQAVAGAIDVSLDAVATAQLCHEVRAVTAVAPSIASDKVKSHSFSKLHVP